MQRIPLLVLAAALIACGGPSGPDGGSGTGGGAGGGGGTSRQPAIGDQCATSPADAFDPTIWQKVDVCQGNSWLTCNRGAVSAYSCSGSLGCAINGNNGLYCDFARAVAGEACPDKMVGVAVCGVDGGSWAKCEDGGTFSVRACSPCFTSGGSVVCN